MVLPARQFFEDGLKLGEFSGGGWDIGFARAAVEDRGTSFGDMVNRADHFGRGIGVLASPLLERPRDSLIKVASRRAGSGQVFQGAGKGSVCLPVVAFCLPGLRPAGKADSGDDAEGEGKEGLDDVEGGSRFAPAGTGDPSRGPGADVHNVGEGSGRLARDRDGARCSACGRELDRGRFVAAAIMRHGDWDGIGAECNILGLGRVEVGEEKAKLKLWLLNIN